MMDELIVFELALTLPGMILFLISFCKIPICCSLLKKQIYINKYRFDQTFSHKLFSQTSHIIFIVAM